MAVLVDTSIRLLSQEPLAGRVGTARLLELAQTLDGAGFHALEVSGGGCFEDIVRRGVESPWERIRALRARCSSPLVIAVRGRFLVGSRPVSSDIVRRFVASAASSGIDVFRMHDPLNDVENLAEAAAAVREAGKELWLGLVYNALPDGDVEHLVERAAALAELGASRVILNDTAGSLDASHARALVERVADASGLPVGFYTQGAAGRALAAAIEAARGGAAPIAVSIYPVAITLFRPSAEALTQTLAGLGLDPGADLGELWRACELVDEALGEGDAITLAPRVAVRAAEHRLPTGVVGGIDASLRVQGLGDRLDEVLDELALVRAAVGWPPLVSPIGQIVGTQALLHVLSGQRWAVLVDELEDLLSGAYGAPPRPVDEAVVRVVQLRRQAEATAGPEPAEPVALEELREQASGLAASEEELLLLALFGEAAEPLLRAIRSRATGDDPFAAAGVETSNADRIRELIEIVQASGIGEVTIEEGETRISVRRSDDRLAGQVLVPVATPDLSPAEEPAGPPPPSHLLPVESPMVGTFYRAPEPGAPPFVQVGDTVAPGQTLCILEAMKLMNEVKADAEAVVRRICVENAEAVEYGQLLFELEPAGGRPADA
ncbi:MAG: acetyl-CoA carboxylase biotin carboxyl carrier protein [Thermoleophilia bacterium]